MSQSPIRKPSTIGKAYYALQYKNGADAVTTQLLCFGSAKGRSAYCQTKAGVMAIEANALANMAALADWRPRICPVTGGLFRTVPVSVRVGGAA